MPHLVGLFCMRRVADASIQLALVSTAVIAGCTLLGPITEIARDLSKPDSIFMTGLVGLGAPGPRLWLRAPLRFSDRNQDYVHID